ncbi:MAG: hypothetical protein UT09_C0001G0003 [Parcubacteria group bacterium GW2011_GWF2_38_8]|nr:MAG: hypothetical protein UT09_C0001G0003 [Parcubacteria group bacterium GW2011_GWF2_38_8]
MLGENKNLRDTFKDSIKDTGNLSSPLLLNKERAGVRYIKTNKLITALYMVTDIMDKEEPIRLKLRTLGVEILSDTSMSKPAFDIDIQKIDQILSFLGIAFNVNMISEMNFNILKKEFTELKQSIQEFTSQNNLWLEEFIQSSSPDKGRSEEGLDPLVFPLSRGKKFNKGQTGTRIGVQKGSTLLKALSNVEGLKALNNAGNGFVILKNKRRESIIKVIKACPSFGGNKPDGINIRDIALAIRSLGEEIGEKTLQRELISMVKDNVLKKTGKKRWSQYSLN